MCRWLAYSGSAVRIEDLLYKPKHSLIDQSLHSQLGAETTNGDGFGIGWYGDRRDAGRLPQRRARLERPQSAQSARRTSSRRSSSPTSAPPRASAIQQTNCHPFRYGRWLWMHNGVIHEFPRVKRDLALAVDPSLYPEIEGSTDSELFFFLALTLGLEDDPPAAVEAAVGLIEETGRRHGVEHPIQMTVATTEGSNVWAFRYSSERQSRSLFYSHEVPTLRLLHPDARGAARTL